MFENYLLRTRSSKNVVNFTRRILSGDNYHIKTVGSKGGGRSENLGGGEHIVARPNCWMKEQLLQGGGASTPHTPPILPPPLRSVAIGPFLFHPFSLLAAIISIGLVIRQLHR